jgi:hypothetical protein
LRRSLVTMKRPPSATPPTGTSPQAAARTEGRTPSAGHHQQGQHQQHQRHLAQPAHQQPRPSLGDSAARQSMSIATTAPLPLAHTAHPQHGATLPATVHLLLP